MAATDKVDHQGYPQDQLIQSYLDHLKIHKRYSKATIKNYNRDLHALLAFRDSQGLSWQTMDTRSIVDFVAAQHGRGLSGRSIGRMLSVVRQFFQYALLQKSVSVNPAIGVRAPKSQKKLPTYLDVDVMHQLLNKTQCDPLRCRDHAMFELMYSSGLRVSELVGIKDTDLDRNQSLVHVQGKGNKHRVVPVGRFAMQAIDHWLIHRQTLVKRANSQFLFVNKKGSSCAIRTVQHRLNLFAKSKGIDQRVHPHALRHACASHLLESSKDLRAVQELLGHASINTTQIYTHLDFQHLASVYDQAHPRAKMKKRKKS